MLVLSDKSGQWFMSIYGKVKVAVDESKRFNSTTSFSGFLGTR